MVTGAGKVKCRKNDDDINMVSIRHKFRIMYLNVNLNANSMFPTRDSTTHSPKIKQAFSICVKEMQRFTKWESGFLFFLFHDVPKWHLPLSMFANYVGNYAFAFECRRMNWNVIKNFAL